MKNFTSALVLVMFSVIPAAFANIPYWQKLESGIITSKGERIIIPNIAVNYFLNEANLKSELFSLSQNPEEGKIFQLPTPYGGFRTFKMWQTPIMEERLAIKYSDIKTFTGYDVNDKFATIKLDFTIKGFHAMVFDKSNTYFIDPYSNINDGFYTCYYKKDYFKPSDKVMNCEVGINDDVKNDAINLTPTGLPNLELKMNGSTKKTYRLALACTGEYAVAVAGVNPAKPVVLSAMITSMNRVNGLYERELAVTMVFIGDEDTLIFLNGSTDPYSNGFGGTMLGENQVTVDARIGAANYDIGHVFSTGGGGIANFGCVCNNGDKAGGVTGSNNPVGDAFDIDYVAHEMGHQFGANHTFNSGAGSCNGNRSNSSAYEPGSGSTILSYAGICGSDNLQPHSDDYFHAKSLDAITNFITTGGGANCPVTLAITNDIPAIALFTQSYSIPYLTAFELTAPTVTDATHDVLNYCWEQWNRGSFGSSLSASSLQGPIFRSFKPDTSPTRVFPALPKLLANTTSVGEKLPQAARFLTFKLTVRDMVNGLGTFNFPDDTIHLDVINTGAPFLVTNPNTAVTWSGGSNQTITWDVANTNVAPINCAVIDIYLSTDGGYTYPVLVKANTPNDGSEIITIPNVATTALARIKVKGTGNVFFDISNANFTINNDPSSVNEISWQNAISVYPNPATEVLHLLSDHNKELSVIISNAIGQKIWSGVLWNKLNISVSNWAKGIYYMQLISTKNDEQMVKKIVIQ